MPVMMKTKSSIIEHKGLKTDMKIKNGPSVEYLIESEMGSVQ